MHINKTNQGLSPMNKLYNNLTKEQHTQKKMSVAPPVFSERQQRSAVRGDSNLFERIPRIMNGKMPEHLNDSVNIGGHYVYTKEDAWNKLNAGSLKIDDAFLNEHGIHVPPINPNEVPREDGISQNKDFIWAGIDLSYASSEVDQLKQSIDYIASRYAVMKDRINAEYTGEERTAHLNTLEQMMSEHRDKLAKKFADEVGGFFEENGVEGEKDRIYQSVLAEIDQKVENYADFIKSNQDYADINGAEEAWLSKDSAYMASELRKAMGSASLSQTKPNSDFDGYTLDEMEKMQAFANEIKSYTKYVDGESKAILTGNESEESLGMKLAELSLKGKIFNEYAGVSERIKDSVTKTIDHLITTAIDKEQQHMDKWSQLQIQGYQSMLAKGEISKAKADEHISAIKKDFTAIDKDAVYAVIDKVTNSYEQTGDATKAIIEGAIFAKETFNQKSEDPSYKGIGRYDSIDVYWNSFFENKNKYYGENFFIQKESGLNCIVTSWNKFMEKITSDSDALMKQVQFSARA